MARPIPFDQFFDARQHLAGIKAAGIRPMMRGNGYSLDAEPITSPELDAREAPACECGAPVYAESLCVACHADAVRARRGNCG